MKLTDREKWLMREAFHAAWYSDKKYQDPDCAFDEWTDEEVLTTCGDHDPVMPRASLMARQAPEVELNQPMPASKLDGLAG